MTSVLKFIAGTFDINVLALFLISAVFFFVNSKEYKKNGLKKEYKFSKFMMYFYIGLGMALYIAARYIRL
jgi:fluoride ion exporter CrcB/FEX